MVTASVPTKFAIGVYKNSPVIEDAMTFPFLVTISPATAAVTRQSIPATTDEKERMGKDVRPAAIWTDKSYFPIIRATNAVVTKAVPQEISATLTMVPIEHSFFCRVYGIGLYPDPGGT